MKQFISQLSIQTEGEGFTNITDRINRWIKVNKISDGILVITCQHTSSSLIINENADPTVRIDFESHFNILAPENKNYYKHKKDTLF